MYGMTVIQAPDPDMPRSASDPSHGNNLPAMLVDVSRGYDRAELTTKERRSVLMRFGFDMKQAEIASHECADRTTITHRLFVAVGKIAASMNGTTWREERELSDDE